MHTDFLETPRLLLRRFCTSDCDALQCIFGDAEVMHYGEGKQSKAWIEGWIEAQGADYDNSTRLGALAVIEKSTNDFLGYAGLLVYPDIGGQPEVEISYRFAKSQWGRGFATEAAVSVRDHALGILRLPRLIALIDPRNTASVHVAQKAGFEYEKAVKLEEHDWIDHVFSIDHALGLGTHGVES